MIPSDTAGKGERHPTCAVCTDSAFISISRPAFVFLFLELSPCHQTSAHSPTGPAEPAGSPELDATGRVFRFDEKALGPNVHRGDYS